MRYILGQNSICINYCTTAAEHVSAAEGKLDMIFSPFLTENQFYPSTFKSYTGAANFSNRLFNSN